MLQTAGHYTVYNNSSDPAPTPQDKPYDSWPAMWLKAVTADNLPGVTDDTRSSLSISTDSERKDVPAGA